MIAVKTEIKKYPTDILRSCSTLSVLVKDRTAVCRNVACSVSLNLVKSESPREQRKQ